MSGIRERRNKEVGVENLNTMKLSETFTNLTLSTYLTSLNHFFSLLKRRKTLKSQPKQINSMLSNSPRKGFVSVLMLLGLSAHTPGELNTAHVLNFYYVDLPFDLFNNIPYLATFDFSFGFSPLPSSWAFHKVYPSIFSPLYSLYNFQDPKIS